MLRLIKDLCTVHAVLMYGTRSVSTVVSVKFSKNKINCKNLCYTIIVLSLRRLGTVNFTSF